MNHKISAPPASQPVWAIVTAYITESFKTEVPATATVSWLRHGLKNSPKQIEMPPIYVQKTRKLVVLAP